MNPRELREARELTLVQLAARADVAIGTIQALERGDNISRKSARRIAKALGISVSDLIGEKAS
jgi:transcriptional regulator with XRE-family HTH domain